VQKPQNKCELEEKTKGEEATWKSQVHNSEKPSAKQLGKTKTQLGKTKTQLGKTKCYDGHTLCRPKGDACARGGQEA
jgi:hypothetical protein